MDNALYVGLSRQMVLRREMDIVANNIANADTSGFKVESLMTKEQPAAPAFTLQGPKPVKFVSANGVARDFGQGGLHRTDDLGRLTTQDGQTVMDEGGGEITFDLEKGQITIAQDGTVSQGSERVGKVGVYQFDTLSVLEKKGGNLLANTSNSQPTPAIDSKVRQGMLEESNVKPILEITRMIEVSRAYEQVTRMMDSQSELTRQTITRMGRLQ
jgi:flagellar basal-body rod protein FlgF